MSNHFLLLTVLLLGLGCQKEDPLAQFRKENPFTKRQDRTPTNMQIVTCRCYPLQIPAEIDVATLAMGRRFESAPGQPAAAQTHALMASNGFPPDQVHLWRRNGLLVSVIPMSRWAALWQSLTSVGAVILPQTLSLIRNPTEVAEFPTLWQDAPASMFVSDMNATLRGYTLPAGDCVFRVSCIPEQTTTENKDLYVRIVPIFRSSQSESKFERDERGRFHRVIYTPTVVFDQLLLSGVVKENHFVCVAAQTATSATENLGNFFLARSKNAENYQMVLLLTPKLETVHENRKQSPVR